MTIKDNHIIMSESQLTKDLYIIATPIGNLCDISARAIETLKAVDIILCEDTRTSSKLLSAYGIETRKLSYHEHNENEMRPKVIRMIKEEGKKLALISDAGMPLVSDPGFKLVQDCIREEVAVTCVPGASASLTALALSGLPTDKFMFAGFLPNKGSARRKALAELKSITCTLIFYETAPRLQESLADILATYGDRQIAVVRELTKKFEEVKTGAVSELIEFYNESGDPRGEIVLVIAGADKAEADYDDEDIDRLLKEAMGEKQLRVKDAAAYVADKLGANKHDLYQRALRLKEE